MTIGSSSLMKNLGLAKEDIPLLGRVCAVADVFDALTSKRPYKDPFPNERAFEILNEGREKHFDTCLADVFFECQDEILAIKESFAQEA